MEEKKTKKPYGYYIGKAIAAVVITCVSTCVMATIISLTYVFLRWILGVIA